MKPILFNTDMVRAILEGRKTVTRLVAFSAEELKPFPTKGYPDGWWFRGRAYVSKDDAMISPQGVMSLCRYRPGDILYVRETFCRQHSEKYPFVYKASVETPAAWNWHPSIHMPREAARIFLRVTDVRVERLQNIDYEGCKAEGIWDDYKTTSEQYHEALAKKAYPVVFSELWDSTIKPADRALYGWAANPWVWVIGFERISRKEAESE